MKKFQISIKCSLQLFILTHLFSCSSFDRKEIDEVISNEIDISFSKVEFLEQKLFVVKLDPNKYQLSLIKSEDGLSRPSKIAKKHSSLIAINAGFFKANGEPAGTFKINNEWLQKPLKNRGAIAWSNTPSAHFIFDRLRLSNEGKIFSDLQSDQEWWNVQENIVGGAPLLIHKGKILDVSVEKTLDSFLVRPYARTAICQDENKQILLVVVEGGDSLSWKIGFRNGLSIYDLSRFLLSQNCVEALNLDGGKSSTMIINDKVINSHPLWHGERKVSDIISIKKKTQTDK